MVNKKEKNSRRLSERDQSLMYGTLVLTFGAVLVKLIGAAFKLPLSGIIGETGLGYFSTAYGIYLPIYTLATAGFPSAIARQVSENVALSRFKEVRKIKSIVSKVLLIAGVFGTTAMILGGFIYVNIIDESNAFFSIMTLAPSVLFCCVMSIYRGYYEGMRNMTPTAISQIIEALGKLILGYGMALGVVKFSEYQYNATGTFLGVQYESLEAATYASYPYASAAAILGISLGSLAGMIYLMIRYRSVGDGITERELRNSPESSANKNILRILYRIGIPIALGVLVMNVTQLIDTVTIQSRLKSIDESFLRQVYDGIITFDNAKEGDVPIFLFGTYNMAINIFNLIPTITQAIGISALPALVAAWASKNKKAVETNINAVMKMTILIAVPCGFGFIALSGPILQLLYHGRPGAIIAEPLLTVLGISVFFNAFLTPVNSMLQAVGKQDLPVKLMLIGASIKLVMNYTLVAIPSININAAPYGTLACYSFIVVCSFIVLKRVSGSKFDYKSVFIKPLTAGVMTGVGAYVSYSLLSRIPFIADIWDGRILTVLAIGIAGIVYFLALFGVKGITRDDVMMLPKGEKFAKALEKIKLIG